ncbi:MAG: AAA family ATPase, partial [Fermentimonas sp.]|nr:AAA family ATPase [Fermentimonas sp.]
MNYVAFISSSKSLLVAPAGYGKTYSIAECLRHTPDNQKQLILTHTHAGVASIKEKVSDRGVESSKYHIETITGFAQKYVLAFCDSAEIPPQEEKGYFDTIIENAIGLFSLDSVKRIVMCTYDGLFVDEYQDCTKKQHQIIKFLSEVLPTRLIGDGMQGIFDFNDTLVDLENDLEDFSYRATLDIPWRWRKEGNNEALGDSIKEIRAILESDNKVVDLRDYPSITYYIINENDIYQASTVYSSQIGKLIRNTVVLPEHESLLLIVPDDYQSSNLESRVSLKTRVDYTRQLTLLEAIDDDKYYEACQCIDALSEVEVDGAQKIKSLRTLVLLNLFNTGEIDTWFNNDCLKIKREP